MIGSHRVSVRGALTALLPFFTFCAAPLGAQTPQVPASSVAGRSITAISYQVGVGSTTVDLKSTGVMSQASGQAKVEAKAAITTVEAQVKGLTIPTGIGAEFLTFVLWAVSPEGRAINLGQVLFDNNGNGRLKVTTQLQTFSLFVTAEPYSAVRQPSEVLILENALRNNTKGKVVVVNNYPLMKRDQYEKLGNPLGFSVDLKSTPLAMYEARNAVEIARSRGAQKYAPEIFAKAESGLKMAESALAQKSNRTQIISLALQTEQSAEDARALTVDRQDQERIAMERAAAAAAAKAQAEAKAAAEAAEAKRKADEAARLQAQQAAAREAEIQAVASAKEAQLKAEAAANQARIQAQAEVAAARAKADADILKAKEDAAKADAERARKAAADLRAQLLAQFNSILQTRDSPRGLVITMADVLFATGKYDLRPSTDLQLAKLSGILLAHPGLHLAIEGYTDNTGSDEFNQKLSEQRAATVGQFLVAQGLPSDSVTTAGFGSAMPVADNVTPAGRQKNRRVEMIVSGESIGVKIATPGNAGQPPQ
jgi:outer membrane protein OmpA-like peptidoglycan-associated protein